MAAAERASLKRNRSTLSPLLTLLHWPGWHSDNRIVKGLPDRWHGLRQHPGAPALYDTERTAVLFCEIVNRWNVWEVGRYLPPKRCNRVDACDMQ